ncbi:MAG: hypothetical protein ACQEQF_01735 [Bacillota bacterium]
MDFSLTDIEKKYIKRDAKELATQMKMNIWYYKEDSTWEPGYDSGEDSDWVEYGKTECTLKEIDEWDIKRQDYGDVTIGDLVLLFPYDTDIPETNKYKIEYQGQEYVSDTGLEPYKPQNNLLMFYTVTFKR